MSLKFNVLADAPVILAIRASENFCLPGLSTHPSFAVASLVEQCNARSNGVQIF